MYDLKCPYCETEIGICHDDGHGCEEDVTYQDECPECEKAFIFHTSIIFRYEEDKADCLNDGKHDMQPYVNHYWPNAKRCKMCGLEEQGEFDQVKYEKDMERQEANG